MEPEPLAVFILCSGHSFFIFGMQRQNSTPKSSPPASVEGGLLFDEPDSPTVDCVRALAAFFETLLWRRRRLN